MLPPAEVVSRSLVIRRDKAQRNGYVSICTRRLCNSSDIWSLRSASCKPQRHVSLPSPLSSSLKS